MKKKAGIFYLFLIVFYTIEITAQISLYQGLNPYSTNSSQGEIIRVNVSSSFSLTINGTWNRNMEINLRMEPDRKNLSFLNSSQQSKNSNRKSMERQNVSEKFNFIISAFINKQDDGSYKITGNRIVTIDGKTTRVQLTGFTDSKSIVNGVVHADSIADLNLFVQSQPQPALDNSYNGGVEDNGVNKEGELAKNQDFTPEQTRKYVIEYLQEILGGLK